MKKLLLIALFGFPLFSFGQNLSQPKMGKDEFKINTLFLIAGAFDVGYERVLNEESAIGVTVFVPITDEINTKFMLTPYYRYYFGQKPATGFYLEGFGSLNNVDDEIYDYSSSSSMYYYKEINVTDFAFGLGLGGKWISKRGVTFEINAGLGRNLFSEYNNEDRNYEFIGRGGISVGYRF